MGFTVSYQTLFEIKLLHHYFLNKGVVLFDNMPDAEKAAVLRGYDVNSFVSIEPTGECARVLSRYRLIFRNTASGILVGTAAKKTAALFSPSTGLEEDLRFTFKVCFRDKAFYNYTALPLLKISNAVYYFQNRQTGSPKKYPGLSTFAPEFSATGTYSAGDMVSDNEASPTSVFIAQQVTGHAPPHADWQADVLVAGKPLCYANTRDLLPLYVNSISYDTGQADLDNLVVKLENRSGGIILPKFDIATVSGSVKLLVDIRLLPEDYYTIRFEDAVKPYTATFSFYRLADTNTPDALIDIVVKSDDPAYSLLDAAGNLSGPAFELRFDNRSTLWRYLGEDYTNLPVSGPHPLTRSGLVAVTVKNKNNTDTADMPNAGINMIKTEHAAGDNSHYNLISEIYIH